MKMNNSNIEKETALPKMETGFNVPEGYFETFGERLKLRMEVEQKPPTHSRTVLYYLKPALGLAAGLAILLSVYLHYPANVSTEGISQVKIGDTLDPNDPSDQFLSNYASVISEGQFISAINEMDQYDPAQMPKDALVDYLASNCSDFEILNASK